MYIPTACGDVPDLNLKVKSYLVVQNLKEIKNTECVCHTCEYTATRIRNVSGTTPKNSNNTCTYHKTGRIMNVENTIFIKKNRTSVISSLND